jgi:hypothetical protein
MHPLQTTFATAEGESAWCDSLRRLIEQTRFAEAEQVLQEALADLTTDMGELCRAAGTASVTISGWPELAERVELHEGDEPITGLTLAIGNDGDLDFEKGRLFSPYMMLGLYTDEAWGWSNATRDVLLAECASECPAWAGTDEDLEAFLEIEGLAALNTALIHSKQRHFIRDGGETQAPLRYVEYIVGCWWRALRFHQAVAAAEAAHPLPGRVTIVSGMVDMRPDVVAVHLPAAAARALAAAPTLSLVVGATADEPTAIGDDRIENSEPVCAAEPDAPLSTLASEPMIDREAGDIEEVEGAEPDPPSLDLISRGMITRNMIEEERPVSGADLRRRIAVEPANDTESPRRGGFLARLFGRA